jgi:hypothetical protein
MLTPDDLIRNARDAYQSRRLVAQGHDIGAGDLSRLLSRNHYYCCAMGASLNPEGSWRSATNPHLPKDQFNPRSDPTDIARSLVSAHDKWAEAAARLQPTLDLENEFRAVINLRPKT